MPRSIANAPVVASHVEVQALKCYNACMQYTIRNIPKPVDKALRAKARRERKSLNQVIVEAVQEGLGLNGKPTKHRDLDWFAGTWVEDPEFDRIIAEQDQVHPDDWK